jgi:hypothetical protein
MIERNLSIRYACGLGRLEMLKCVCVEAFEGLGLSARDDIPTGRILWIS